MATVTGGCEVMSDEIKNIKCSVCARKDRIREAEKYCLQCKDYYCISCTDLHSDFPSMSGHKLMDKTDFRSLAADTSLPSVPTQRCSLHPTKLVDMFCKDHNDVACAQCIALTHRTCTNIHCIPDDVDMYDSKAVINTKQKLHQMKETLETINKAKETKLQELQENLEKEVESIHNFRKQIESMLDKMEQETISHLKKEVGKLEAKLKEEKNGIEKLIEGLTDVAAQLEKADGNAAQEFVSMKSAEKAVAKAGDVEGEYNRTPKETITFTADQSIMAFLTPLQELGKISLCPKVTLHNVKNERKINVKHETDSKTCVIWGLCITDDDFLLITDNVNKQLKRLSMSTETLQDCLALIEKPADVCQTNQNEAAMSLVNKTVQLVLLRETMTITKTLTMNHKCLGIAHRDGKLFISDYGSKVYIHNMNGEELLVIPVDSDQEILKENRHITLSAQGYHMYVADAKKDLVILNTEGKHLSTCTDATVRSSNGVCSDGRSIFVSGYESNNVVQFGQDYRMLGQLAKVTKPYAVQFDHKRSWLMVSQDNSNYITVLELE